DIVNAALNLAYHLQAVPASSVPGNPHDGLFYLADYNPQQNPSSPSADFHFGTMTTILQGITSDGIPAIPDNVQCTVFVNAVLQYVGQMGQLGARFPNAVDFGNSSVAYSLPHVNGQQWQTFPPSTLPQLGDVVTWADSPNPSPGHVGIVVGVEQPSG